MCVVCMFAAFCDEFHMHRVLNTYASTLAYATHSSQIQSSAPTEKFLNSHTQYILNGIIYLRLLYIDMHNTLYAIAYASNEFAVRYSTPTTVRIMFIV